MFTQTCVYDSGSPYDERPDSGIEQGSTVVPRFCGEGEGEGVDSKIEQNECI